MFLLLLSMIVPDVAVLLALLTSISTLSRVWPFALWLAVHAPVDSVGIDQLVINLLTFYSAESKIKNRSADTGVALVVSFVHGRLDLLSRILLGFCIVVFQDSAASVLHNLRC